MHFTITRGVQEYSVVAPMINHVNNDY